MRDSERPVAVMIGLGFYGLGATEDSADDGPPSPPTDGKPQAYDVSGGGDSEVPLIGLTLLRLILTRLDAGEYHVRQALALLRPLDAAESMLDLLYEDPDMANYADLMNDAPDEVLSAWLAKYLRTNEWTRVKEQQQDEAIYDLAEYLPRWARYEVEEAGWSGGAGGTLELPANRTLAEVQDHVQDAVEARLRDLEPPAASPLS